MTAFSAHPFEEVATDTTDTQQHPVVAGLANGGYVVAWESFSGGTTGVFAQQYDAQGHKVGGQVTAFANAPSTLMDWTGYRVGGVAGLADGSFVVSAYAQWVDPTLGNQSQLFAQRVDASGSTVSSPVLVASGSNDSWAEAGPVLALPGGGYAVVEQRIDHPQPFAQVSEVVHTYNAANVPLGTPATAQGWAPSAYDVAVMRNGDFVTAALSTGTGATQLTWSVNDASGSLVSTSTLGNVQGVQYADPTVVGLANGDALVAWQVAQVDSSTGAVTSRAWQAQMLDANGHAQGSIFGLPIDATAGTAVHLTALGDGGFMATWPKTPFPPAAGEIELMGEYFNAAGQPAGEVIHFNFVPNVDWTYYLPYGIAATSDGGFVLSGEWSGTSALDVHEQKFDVAAPGTPGPYIEVADASTVQIPAGNFRIGGDGPTAQVALASQHTAWTFTPDEQGMLIAGPEGVDLLVNVNRVQFGDGMARAFDVDWHAGEAYRLYQAAFARAPDLAGLGFHIHDLDGGVPLWGVAQHFVDSPEFQSTYGTPDNTQFITLLYENVLHREPDQAGLQFHLNEFAQGETRADMLTHFSESPENQANVLGQIATGMWYVPIG